MRMGRMEEARKSLAWALMIDPMRLPPASLAEVEKTRWLTCSNIRGWLPPDA
jgi:hypothetical protein